MSAEILRRAATLMRERAEAATSGQWLVDADAEDFPVLAPDTPHFTWDGVFICTTRLDGKADANRADAEHIASWTLTVARAVADWLDNVSEHAERYNDGLTRDALTVARTYLGEAS